MYHTKKGTKHTNAAAGDTQQIARGRGCACALRVRVCPRYRRCRLRPRRARSSGGKDGGWGGVSCLALSRSFSGDDLGNDPSRAAFQYGYVRALEDVCDMSTPHNDVQYVLRFICCWACGLWPVACGLACGSAAHFTAQQQQQTLTHSQAQYCTVLYPVLYSKVLYCT
jgi:hypothetical protein